VGALKGGERRARADVSPDDVRLSSSGRTYCSDCRPNAPAAVRPPSRVSFRIPLQLAMMGETWLCANQALMAAPAVETG
jgi:hypothetical protein